MNTGYLGAGAPWFRKWGELQKTNIPPPQKKENFRGRPDDIYVGGGGGGYGFFQKKKKERLLRKSDKRIVCSANCKNEHFVHKTGRKMGLCEGGGEICLFLWMRGKKVCFWLGAKKKKSFHRGKPVAPAYHLVLPLLGLYNIERTDSRPGRLHSPVSQASTSRVSAV